MNHHEQTRKGQSAIEYLSTYGWALLAILVVVGAIMEMGVLNPCSQQTPRFAGQGARIAGWSFNATNGVQVTVEGSSPDTTLNWVRLTMNSGNTYNWSGSQTVGPNTDTTVFVSTGSEFSSGQCMKADATLSYTTADGRDGLATGEGKMQGTAP